MSLDKAIEHGKEHRKPYRGSKRWDQTCRNHGACSYCESGRRHAERKQYGKLEDQEDEWFGYWGYPDGLDVISDLDEEAHEKIGMTAQLRDEEYYAQIQVRKDKQLADEREFGTFLGNLLRPLNGSVKCVQTFEEADVRCTGSDYTGLQVIMEDGQEYLIEITKTK